MHTCMLMLLLGAEGRIQSSLVPEADATVLCASDEQLWTRRMHFKRRENTAHMRAVDKTRVK